MRLLVLEPAGKRLTEMPLNFDSAQYQKNLQRALRRYSGDQATATNNNQTSQTILTRLHDLALP